MTMPEEINRLVTVRLSDLLLTSDELSSENLRKERVPEEWIRFVDNIMIDTLEAQREKAQVLNIVDIIQKNAMDSQKLTHNREVITGSAFALMTLHRPSNVDDPDALGAILVFLCGEACAEMLLIWPIHPRTEHKLKCFGMWEAALVTSKLLLLRFLGYHEMLCLNMDGPGHVHRQR